MHTPALEQLMKGYFHQDWDTYGPDSRSVVRVFVDDDRGTAERLPAEVDAVLAAALTESEIAAMLEGFGCQTDPMSTDGTHRTWLIELVAYAQVALAE